MTRTTRALLTVVAIVLPGAAVGVVAVLLYKQLPTHHQAALAELGRQAGAFVRRPFIKAEAEKKA